jgi:hypothetical protein
MVRVRRRGWRLRLAPRGWLGVLGPVSCVLVSVFSLGLAATIVGLFVLPLPAAIVATATGTGDVLKLGLLLWPVSAGSAMGLTYFIGITNAADAYDEFATRFLRVDLRPAGAPRKVVVTGWDRRSVIRIADLTGVHVRQTIAELHLVRRGKETVVCRAATRVDPDALAGWLSEILAASGVPVEVR